MTSTPDSILDNLFHGCAFAAYAKLAGACGGVPDADATRRLADRCYEEQLVARNGAMPIEAHWCRGQRQMPIGATELIGSSFTAIHQSVCN